MSAEYSLEEVRARFEAWYPGSGIEDGDTSAKVAARFGYQAAYADLLERIKAGEGAVPVATDAQVEAIIKSVHSGYGIDESSWSQLLVRAALESKAVAQPLPMGKDGDGVVPALWIEFTDDGQNIRLWTRNGQQAAEEIREGRKLLAFYARPPAQAMNEQSGISGQLEFRKGLLEGLSMAKSECDNRVFALDGGDNQFRREATASQCAEAIRLVYARMFREMTATPATHPPAQAAQVDASNLPPCSECGAKSAAEAETMCICSGDKDDCHGTSIWPDDAPTAEPVAQGEAEWLERLKDPETVHALMLRGVIAVPSIRSMVDLRGEVPNGDEVQLLRIAELQEQIAAHLAQPRAVPAERRVVVDSALIPRHYASNIGYAACMMESSQSVLDRREAPILREIAALLAAAPQPGES